MVGGKELKRNPLWNSVNNELKTKKYGKTGENEKEMYQNGLDSRFIDLVEMSSSHLQLLRLFTWPEILTTVAGSRRANRTNGGRNREKENKNGNDWGDLEIVATRSHARGVFRVFCFFFCNCLCFCTLVLLSSSVIKITPTILGFCPFQPSPHQFHGTQFSLSHHSQDPPPLSLSLCANIIPWCVFWQELIVKCTNGL